MKRETLGQLQGWAAIKRGSLTGLAKVARDGQEMAEMLGTLRGFAVSIQLHSEAVGRSQERQNMAHRMGDWAAYDAEESYIKVEIGIVERMIERMISQFGSSE